MATENKSDAGSALIDDMISHAPKANEEIVSALVAEPTPEPATNTGTPAANPPPVHSSEPINRPVSDAGSGANAFDPVIHATNGDGTPKKNQDGTYAKKRGRKPGSRNVGAVASDVAESAVDYGKLGQFVGGMLTGSCVTVFGDEWLAKPEEQGQIDMALAAYAKSKNWSDLPPGLIVLCVFTIYAAPRMTMPKTRERMRTIGESFGIVKPKAKPAEVPAVIQNPPANNPGFML